MVLSLEPATTTIAIAQIVVSIFTLIYAFDVLVLHRRFRQLGDSLAQNISWFTIGIFLVVLSFTIDAFDVAREIATIGEVIGIGVIGFYFRQCMHGFIKQPPAARAPPMT